MKQSENTRAMVELRYAAAAQKQEAALCCPVDYDARYLEAIPGEVIERDYGCGDPSKWLQAGETVLDLGSGTGKICFIASQVVGPQGKVIGVDMTDDMLEVARRNAPSVAENIGHSNVEFRKGRIQDLALDLDKMDAWLEKNPVSSAQDYLRLDGVESELRSSQPLVADDSVDVVVSNCVLNLVESDQKSKLFHEIFRVLRPGGRAVISDIVSSEEVPLAMRQDSDLWSGCISGAFTEQGFVQAFVEAGFSGAEYVKFETKPWQTVEGIDFRPVTIRAYKPVTTDGLGDAGDVVYLGPFESVRDDEGNLFERGKRYRVSAAMRAKLHAFGYGKFFADFGGQGEQVGCGDSCCC